MSGFLYVWIKRIWYYDQAPESAEWYADLECDSKVTGMFDDSVSEVKQIPCLLFTEDEEYASVNRSLRREEANDKRLRAFAVKITERDFIRLERSEV